MKSRFKSRVLLPLGITAVEENEEFNALVEELSAAEEAEDEDSLRKLLLMETVSMKKTLVKRMPKLRNLLAKRAILRRKDADKAAPKTFSKEKSTSCRTIRLLKKRRMKQKRKVGKRKIHGALGAKLCRLLGTCY